MDSDTESSSDDGITLEELERSFGSARAAELVWSQAMALVAQDPDQAFRLMRASEPIQRRAGDDVLIKGWRLELQMLQTALSAAIRFDHLDGARRR